MKRNFLDYMYGIVGVFMAGLDYGEPCEVRWGVKDAVRPQDIRVEDV